MTTPRRDEAVSPAVERVAIVVVERGPQGARIVAVDEQGARQYALVAPATTFVRDNSPSVSPDGRWLVFASTRDRASDETSLWIAPIGVEVVPARLTTGNMIDAHPTWTPDGRAIVFASTREGPHFDLWQLAIVNGRAAGTPIRLTSSDAHEVQPTIASDGSIVYAAVRPRAAEGPRDRPATDSWLEERTPDGTIRKLTDGPADNSPALSPDGRTIAFSRDGELWLMPAGAPDRARLVAALPLTEENNPVWSRDGRFLLASSIFRGDQGRPLFSSVIHIDLLERDTAVRILRDRVGPIVRLSAVVVAEALDVRSLHGQPEYVPELARIMTAAITNAKTEQP